MKCRVCQEPLQWIHGHGQCETPECALKGQNQVPCCEGETALPDVLSRLDDRAEEISAIMSEYVRDKIGLPQEDACKLCGGTGSVLHLILRPGGPPGNQLLPCPECRADEPPIELGDYGG